MSRSKTVILIKRTDWKKYGFVQGRNSKEWIIWGNVKHIYFDEKDRILHFNMLTLDTIAKVIEMAKDGVLIVENVIRKHQVLLTDAEYEAVLKMREVQHEQ